VIQLNLEDHNYHILVVYCSADSTVISNIEEIDSYKRSLYIIIWKLAKPFTLTSLRIPRGSSLLPARQPKWMKEI
jgi:hypothetical protein